MLLFKKIDKVKECDDGFMLQYNQSDRIPVHLLEIEEEVNIPVNVEELLKIELENTTE